MSRPFEDERQFINHWAIPAPGQPPAHRKNMSTPIVQLHRRIKKSLKTGKGVYYRFLDTVNTPVSSAFYYQPDRCIIFYCDGKSFHAFPSQLDRFEFDP